MKKKIITNTYLNEAIKHEIKLFLDEEYYFVSVKKLVHLSEKFIIRNNVIAMDDGYYILEIIPKNDNYALRVFLNDKKEVIEYYFDIIKESGIDKEYKVPYFNDHTLFLSDLLFLYFVSPILLKGIKTIKISIVLLSAFLFVLNNFILNLNLSIVCIFAVLPVIMFV